jgi:hypothetical protein
MRQKVTNKCEMEGTGLQAKKKGQNPSLTSKAMRREMGVGEN